MTEKADTMASVLAEIAAYGAFLPTTEKRMRKNGKVKVYEAQPIYTYTDAASGKQKSKRIPKAAYGRVLDLTRKHKGMKKLIARFEAAAVAENLDGGAKKNSSR